jgi:hypothetical protein
VLAACLAAATTEVEDVDGGPPRGAVGISGSGHHRSWRRRWRASWGVLAACSSAATTEVEDVDGGRAKCRSGFMTLPLVLLQEQPAVVLLLGRVLVSWSLAIDERCGHQVYVIRAAGA